jgi:hypothetical protein
MPDVRTAAEQLLRAAIQYRDACEDRDGAMAYLKQAVREADVTGVPRRRIAQLAGISPQTVYNWLPEGQL